MITAIVIKEILIRLELEFALRDKELAKLGLVQSKRGITQSKSDKELAKLGLVQSKRGITQSKSDKELAKLGLVRAF